MDLAGADLFVQAHGREQFVPLVTGQLDERGQSQALEKHLDALNVRGRQSGSTGRKMSRSHLANANGLTMEELAVARGILNGMADGVTKIEGCPNSRLGFVLGNDLCFDGAAPGNDG